VGDDHKIDTVSPLWRPAAGARAGAMADAKNAGAESSAGFSFFGLRVRVCTVASLHRQSHVKPLPLRYNSVAQKPRRRRPT
jgi:hypothetical protein